MSEPREFMLEFEGEWNTWKVAYDFSDPEMPDKPEHTYMIKVIEYSAMDALRDEYSALKAKTDALAEALEDLIDECRFENPNPALAQQALAKYRGGSEGE